MKRTTLTLEDDVARRLAEEARRTGRSFKDVVNATLRLGLERRHQRASPPFRVRARPLGLRAGLDYSNIEELLDRVEGPARP